MISEVVIPVSMQEMGKNAKVVSESEESLIANKIEQMNQLAIDINSGKDSNNKLLLQYNALANQMKLLGTQILSEDQILDYLHTEATQTQAISESGIVYPDVKGMRMEISFYTLDGYKMANVYITQVPNVISPLVKNYNPVNMMKGYSYNDMGKKLISMGANKLGNYYLASLVGGKATFAINTIYNLGKDVIPKSQYSSSAQLNLTVSTNSTIIHMWKYINDKYYLRTSTVKARVSETWTFSDVNGGHYSMTNVYDSYSEHYFDMKFATTVNYAVSYGIYQPYYVENSTIPRLEVVPYTASNALQLVR